MSSPGNLPSGKIRFQVDVTSAEVTTFNRLEEVCGFNTRRELFDNAMTLFEWAVDEVLKGNVVAAVNEQTQEYVEIRMPALTKAARSRVG